jgi:hypothetical protein
MERVPHFDFTIEGMTERQANALLDIIIAFCNAIGLGNSLACTVTYEKAEAADGKA